MNLKKYQLESTKVSIVSDYRLAGFPQLGHVHFKNSPFNKGFPSFFHSGKITGKFFYGTGTIPH